MATKHVPEYPSSPTNDDSDDDGQESVGSNFQEEEEEEEEQQKKPSTDDVASILKRIPSAVVFKKPKEEYHCFTCSENFSDRQELHCHLIQHVSLPSVVVDKLPSDDETPVSGDENWSDEEEASPPPPAPKTPQKIDISQILKKTGLSLKKSTEPDKSADSALNKLSGLGFTIKKSNTPIKKEPEPENKQANDVMQKLGKLGGIKLKLKSDGNNSNSFKVINGLKDFNASEDEDDGSGNDDSKEDGDGEDQEKSGEQEGSGGENDSDENEQSAPPSRKSSESDELDSTAVKRKLANSLKNLKGKAIIQKMEPPIAKPGPPRNKEGDSPMKIAQPVKPPGRPAIKQTPKRGANLPFTLIEVPKLEQETPASRPAATPERRDSHTERRQSSSSNPERRESRDSTMDNVVVKKEKETVETPSSNVPLFSTQIKSERTSPPPNEITSTPVLAMIKTEPGLLASTVTTQPAYNQYQSIVLNTTTPLLPVTKKEEDTSMTIIEINGDSNDEDDDCCVVSATPAPELKPKTEFVPSISQAENPVSYPPPSYPTSQPSFSTASSTLSTMLSNRLTGPTTEKQHNFNWNAPDSKPALDILEKSADDIFDSLLSCSTKKENLSLSDASEYISLDTLGPQHTCDVCNTRFTDTSLLDEHRRMTGHSKSLLPVATSTSTLIPYAPASNLLSSLLPVKQLADQVGKLSTIGGSGPGFTHQQNVMINIQAYPGASGVMMPPQSYNSFAPGQVQPDFSQGQNNMYAAQGQPMPGQYPGQAYVGPHGYGQYQGQMPKPGYPGVMPQNQFPPSSSPYSTASPLQSMQQAVYGQAGSIGQMGPPAAPPYVPASSPGGSMKPPNSSGIKIQNVQTFPPGQALGQMMPGQSISGPEMGGQPTVPGQVVGQMAPPNQIRMAPGANITGIRPRLATPRGPRPTIRPGIQVHTQVRAQKPGMRMPLKRPGMPSGPMPKRRPDMLLPGKHDNEDCQVMAMQKQREGLPMIQSVQGAKDKLNIGSQISITKKTVNKEANAMANVLASRGISVKQKQKSRSPTPERPVPHIPNLGAGVSIKHTSKSSNFSIPEAKVGGGMLSCKICKKMFMNQNSLSVHMSNAHPQCKVPVFKCDECPASYPKSLQLQHHKRVFHNVSGPNRELGLPVVDLSQEDNLKRLSNLGIYSFIPLANREQASGCFGIPVLSVHNAQNGLTSRLQALGADGLLSLGPLKPLPNS